MSAITAQAAVLLTPDLAPSEHLGGKGQNLAQLVRAGMAVPPSGVVTTLAYQAMAAASPAVTELVSHIEGGARLSADEVDDVFHSSITIPNDVADEIVALARRIGGGANIAVRSSATVEDLGGSSFAGQYRSVLDVDAEDADEVLAAVRAVWASLWHPAPSAYRRAFDIPESEAAMAVVLMQMVDVDTAGVVFTADPGGATDAARIEAVEGYGEKLVSGEETPEAWVLPHRRQDRPPVSDVVNHAVDAALEIEEYFGVPQDVEWAAAGGELYVLQARPITVLDDHDGFDTPVDDHELTTAGIVEMVPGVLAPLRWELNRFLLEESFRCVLDDLGVLAATTAEDRMFVRRVRGRAAIDFDQLRSVASAIPGAVEELELQYFGDQPTVPRDDRRSWTESARHDLRVLRTRRRVIEQAEVVMRAADMLADRLPRITDWSDERLMAYRLRLTDLAGRGLAGELGVAAAGAAAYRRLELQLERHFGAKEAARLAQQVTSGAAMSVARRPTSSAAVFAGPTWTELGKSPLAAHSATDTVALRHDLERRLQALPGWTRRRILTGQIVDVRLHLLRRTIAETNTQLHRREAAKAAVLELGGEVRRVHLELGTRLVARGLLHDATDIELMSSDELRTALDDGAGVPLDVLRRRRNWLSRYEAEGQLPPRFVGVPDRTPAPLPVGNRLEGWAASPGRYHGVACVRESPDTDLPPGAVLVASATDASYSPLFINAGAIVVERGGPLSHAAILARELGLPAVLNVAGATRALDGRLVTVDGDAGVVVIVEDSV